MAQFVAFYIGLQRPRLEAGKDALGLVERSGRLVDQLEVLVHEGEAEHAVDVLGRAHDHELRAPLESAGVGRDHGTQAGRVHELELAQVEHERRRPGGLDLRPGKTEETTLPLKAGKYVLFCNISRSAPSPRNPRAT